MRRLKFLLLFTFSVLLFAVSTWRFPVPMHGAPELLKAVGVDLLLFAVAAAWGRRFLVRLKLFHRSLTEELVFSTALGLLALSLLGNLLGALGALYDWVLWLGVGLLLITQWDHLEHFSREFSRNLRVKQPWDGSSSEVLALVAGVLGLMAALVLCLAPVTFYDALNYHLAGVHRAVQSAVDLPQANNIFSWLPDLAQPLWIQATLLADLPLTNTAPAALLNFFVALLLGLALVDASSRWLSERKLWLAPALAWTQPVLVLSFGVFSPDGWMAFFAFLSFYAFLCATEEDDQRQQGPWLGLSALLAGAACAAKPTAALHVLALSGLLLWELRQRPSWRRWTWALAGAFLVVLPLLPWMLRGAWLRSQPIYPFRLNLFGHAFLQGAPNSYFDEMASYGRGPWWRLPWDLFFSANTMGGNGHISWFLLALAPAAYFWKYSATQRRTLWYLGLSLIVWSVGPHVLRYGLFALPAACLLAVHGSQEVERWAASKGWAYAWRALVLAGLFLGAGQSLVIATKDFQPWAPATGSQDAISYLSSRAVPGAEAAAWIRSRPGPRKVLVLGDSRTAYLPAGALASSYYEVHPFRVWAARADSAQDLGAIVRRKGYDFVLVDRARWALLETPADPLYWAQGDTVTAERVQSWIQGLAADPQRPHLALSNGAGWVYDLR